MDDLDADVTEINDVEAYYTNRIGLYDSVLKNSLTIDYYMDYTFCSECYNLISAMNNFVLNKSGYSLLKSGIEITEYKNMGLLRDIEDFYSNSIFGVDHITSILSDDVLNTNKLWRDNYNWYSEYLLDTHNPPDEMKYYLASSREYKNLVAYHKLWVVYNYLPFLNYTKEESLKLIENIDNEINP